MAGSVAGLKTFGTQRDHLVLDAGAGHVGEPGFGIDQFEGHRAEDVAVGVFEHVMVVPADEGRGGWIDLADGVQMEADGGVGVNIDDRHGRKHSPRRRLTRSAPRCEP